MSLSAPHPPTALEVALCVQANQVVPGESNRVQKHVKPGEECSPPAHQARLLLGLQLASEPACLSLSTNQAWDPEEMGGPQAQSC